MLTGGLFAQYFRNITATWAIDPNNFCDPGQKIVRFSSNTDGTYGRPLCDFETWQYNGTDYYFNTSNNLGIGITNPTATLHLSGTLRMDLPGPEQDGAILRSDVNGNLSWYISTLCVPTWAGVNNYCHGLQSLQLNTTGQDNLGLGYRSLRQNTIWSYNSALGSYALWSNTSGNYNAGYGYTSLVNTTGTGNSAYGASSLYNVTTGNYNTAIGYLAGNGITTGSRNIVIGQNATVPNPAGSDQISIGNMIYGTWGKIGIGTNTPSEKLDVAGNIFLSQPNATIQFNAWGPSISVPTGNTLTLGTSGLERMRIDNNGNVGIGTNAPQKKLHVVADGITDEVARFWTNGNPYLSLYRWATRNAYWWTDASNNMILMNERNAATYIGASGSYMITAHPNGNVGIGTTTPLADLEIRREGTDSSLLFHDPSDAWYSMGIDVSDARKFKINYGSGVGNYTHFTMTSIWNVGIWTSTPWAKLEVVGDSKLGDVFGWVSGGTRAIWKFDNTYPNHGIFYTEGTPDALSFSPSGNGTLNPDMIVRWTNVGIGTNNPQDRLDVAGNIRSSIYYDRDDTNYFMNPDDVSVIKDIRIAGANAGSGRVLTSDSIGRATWLNLPSTLPGWIAGNTLYHNGTSWVASSNIFNNNGNVGIGITTPGTKLDVNGSIRTNNQLISSIPTWTSPLIVWSTTLVNNLNVQYLNGQQWSYYAPINSPSLSGDPRSITPALGDNDTSIATTAFVKSQGYLTGANESDPQVGVNTTNYLSKWNGSALVTSTIFDNGNIGIGTSSPSAKLTIVWWPADPLQLSDGTRSFRVWPSVGVAWGFQIYDNQATAVRMRIDNSGNIGIGTTTPGARLDVNGSIISNWYIRAGNNLYTDANYGFGLVGLYDPNRYQWVFAMGDSYKLAANGGSPGNLYGIAWTHENVWGQSKPWLSHQALFMMNWVTYTAIGNGIWTNGNVQSLWNIQAAWSPVPSNWYNLQAWSVGVSTAYAYDSFCTGNASSNCQWANGVILWRANNAAYTNFPNSGDSFISGNLGIGTNTPGAKLEVAWSTLANNHIVKAWNGNGFCFWGDCNNFTISMSDSALYRYGPVTDYSIKTQMDASVPGRWFTWGRAGVAPVAALNATSGNFQTAGSVTASSLNVGSVRISGGSPWAGKVLTSDATGNASWEANAAAGYRVEDFISKWNQSTWTCRTLDLTNECSTADGCLIRINQTHETTDEVRTIWFELIVENDTHSNNNWGWKRGYIINSIGNANAFNSSSPSGLAELSNWWWWVTNYSPASWCFWWDTLWANPYTYTFRFHPNVSARVLIKRWL
jgi:hypothetical protein